MHLHIDYVTLLFKNQTMVVARRVHFHIESSFDCDYEGTCDNPLYIVATTHVELVDGYLHFVKLSSVLVMI